MYLVFYLDILISSWKKINCPDSIIYYTTYFRGSLAEVFEVVFIIFSKPRGKHFSVYTSLLDKVAQLTFTLAFYKLFQAATLQQKDSSKGFCKFLRFLTEHPKANTFVPFRSLWDFTTTVFLLFHWDSCPCATLRKRHSRKVGPWPRTL